MSLPVYLDSSPFDHMPNGNQNEWKDFFKPNTYEFEANAFFPLFWLLLFSQDNIKRARYIDQYDIDDERSSVDREECFDDFGESTFPYFIASQAQALANLEKRKAGFLKIFGQEFENKYDHFSHIIQENFPKFILLRPNGLDLGEQDEEFFRKDCIVYENLEHEITMDDLKYWNDLKQDMRRYKNDLTYFLYGYNHAEQKTKNQENINLPENNQLNTKNTNSPNIKKISEKIIWIIVIIVALATVIVLLQTQSIWYAIITFFVLAFTLSFLVSKFLNR